MARSTPTPTTSTTPLRLKRKDGQLRTHQLLPLSDIGVSKSSNNKKPKMDGQGYHQLLLPPHLGLKEKMDSQWHTSFCHCPTLVYQKTTTTKNQRWMARGTPTLATTPLRLKGNIQSKKVKLK